MAKKKIPDVAITRIATDQGSKPAVLMKGKPPKTGAEFQFRLANGVTYSAKVSDTVEAGGEALVEFAGPIKPI